MVKFVTNQTEITDNSGVYEIMSFEEAVSNIEYLSGFIGVDTETEGFDPYRNKLLSLQIGNADIQYVIDWQHAPKSFITDLAKIFRNDNVYIFHNAKFDLRFLMLQNIWPKNVYDTFIGESVLYQGLSYEKFPKGLADIADRYLGVKLDKSIRGQIHWQGLTPTVIKYAADDVKYLPELRERQFRLIEDKKLYRTLSLENEFTKVLAYMEMCGLRINVDQWKERVTLDKKVLADKLEALNNYITRSDLNRYVDNQLDLFNEGLKCSINWSSPTQVANFFKDLGLDLLVKDKETGKMKYSVDAKVLLPQIKKDPVIEVYLDFKSQEKVITTYGDNWLEQIHPVTGRIHTQFKQLLDTGRISSGGRDKKTKKNYVNILNIPQENSIRNCIIPADGKVFIDSDYSSQEQVVLANFSKEPKLLEFYAKNLEGGDMHTFICKKLWPELESLSVEEVKTKHKDKRHMAKIAGFSINYGGVGATIANNLSMSIEVGNQVYESYMKAFPQLKEYFAKQKKTALNNGYILTDNVSGRKIFLNNFERFQELKSMMDSDFWDKYKAEKSKDSSYFNNTMKPIVREYAKMKGDYERMALNYPIQGASASITKLACIYVLREIEKYEMQFKVLFTAAIHDQILLEVPEQESQKWSDIVKECMERAGTHFCTIVKLKAEPEILKIWKK
jgi:DNA polymerase-1